MIYSFGKNSRRPIRKNYNVAQVCLVISVDFFLDNNHLNTNHLDTLYMYNKRANFLKRRIELQFYPGVL